MPSTRPPTPKQRVSRREFSTLPTRHTSSDTTGVFEIEGLGHNGRPHGAASRCSFELYLWTQQWSRVRCIVLVFIQSYMAAS